MTQPLIPPNPDVSAEYWLHMNYDSGARVEVCGGWRASFQNWCIGRWILSPEQAAERGYTLASRHPIPGPAALDRLHSPDEAMVGTGVVAAAMTGDVAEIFAAMLAEALKP